VKKIMNRHRAARCITAEAENFDIDAGKGEGGLPEGMFGGGDKSVLKGDFCPAVHRILEWNRLVIDACPQSKVTLRTDLAFMPPVFEL
jgi:hypothetical protein